MQEIGIGMFGYGFMAASHAAALRQAGGRVVAVCGPRREAAHEFARRHGIAGVDVDPAALLARHDVQAVVVATPDAAHAPLAIAAAHAGKHVFCEKPLARSLDEARAIVTAVRQAGTVGMTGFLLRGAPVVRRMAEVIARGEAGTVISLHTQRYNSSLLRPDATTSWRTDETESGLGVLGDLGSHMVDLAHLLVGPIAEVSADMMTFVRELPERATGVRRPLSLDDDVTLQLRFAGGAHGTISLSRVGLADAHLPLGRSQIVVNGSKLALVSDGVEHATAQGLDGPPHEWAPDARVASLDHGALLTYLGEELMRAFLGAIRSGISAAPTLDDGLAVQAVLDAAVRAARSRAWERVVSDA